MRSILLLMVLLVTSCSTTDFITDKPLTTNIPSTDKLVREGTPLGSAPFVRDSSKQARTEYDALQRLYDTTWFQTEREFDDGGLEEETEFVIFNSSSWIVEREMENGRMEAIEADDYKKATVVDASIQPDLNAIIVRVREHGDNDIEFEGYWLKDSETLYIVEEDTQAQATTRLRQIIAANGIGYADRKYLLSTVH